MSHDLNIAGTLVTAIIVGVETKSFGLGLAVAIGMFTMLGALYSSRPK
jgi:hypothetical protein